MVQHIIYSVMSQATAEEPVTWFTTIVKGGPVGFIIIALSLVALALVVMHILQIRRTSLLPQEQLLVIEQW